MKRSLIVVAILGAALGATTACSESKPAPAPAKSPPGKDAAVPTPPDKSKSAPAAPAAPKAPDKGKGG